MCWSAKPSCSLARGLHWIRRCLRRPSIRLRQLCIAFANQLALLFCRCLFTQPGEQAATEKQKVRNSYAHIAAHAGGAEPARQWPKSEDALPAALPGAATRGHAGVVRALGGGRGGGTRACGAVPGGLHRADSALTCA